MKKKLIQFLMLSVIAVSIGAFVSCKDTNEDLYNELRDEVGLNDPNGSLADRLKKLQADLDDLKGKTGNCNCNDCSGEFTELWAALAKLGMGSDGSGDIGGANIGGGGSDAGAGFTLGDLLGNLEDFMGETTYDYTLAEVFAFIEQHSANITEIENWYKTYGADLVKLLAGKETVDNHLSALDDKLKALQDAIDALGKCDCDSKFTEVWDQINLIEKGLKDAKDQTAAVLDYAQKIENDYKDAVKAVEDLAQKAIDDAKVANDLAAKAEDLAKKAQGAADAAQGAADAAQKAAEDAAKLAQDALDKAIAALELESRIKDLETTVDALEGRVKTNEDNIKALQNHMKEVDAAIADYEKRIGKNEEEIVDIKKRLDDVEKYAENIEANAKAIKELSDKLDTLDGKITGVDTKAQQALDKASEAFAKAKANEEYIQNVEKIVTANATAIEDLQKAQKQLEETVDGLSKKVEQNENDIKRIDEAVKTLQDNVKTMGDDITKIQGDIKDLQDRVKAVEDELVQVKEDCAKNLQEAKNYTDTEIAAAKVAIMAAVTAELEKYYTKEEIDQMLKDVDDNIQKLKIELMEDYTLKITTLEQTLTVRLDNLETAVGNLGTTVGDHEGRIKTLEDLVKEITSCTCDEEAMQKSIELLKTMLNNIRDDIEANDELYKQLIQGNTDAIDAINKKIEDELNKRIEELATSVDGLTTNFEKLKDIIYKNYATKAYVEEITNAIIEDIEDVKENVQDNTNRIDELAEQLAEYAGLEARVATLQSIAIAFEDKFDEIDEQLDGKVDIEDYEEDISNIIDLIQVNATDISDLQDAVEGINEDIATLKKEQDNLKGRMDDAEKALKALEDKIDTEINEVKEKIAEIQNNLAKQVTSINLQAATNPWFGMISTPFGTQSNFVIALYGTPMSEVVFPATQYTGGNYVRPSESLTAKDMQMIGNVSETFDAGWPIMFKYDKDEDYAYAGKIYMTINPNTANLDGLKMSIVNTADEESPITLSPITKSEEKLQFGWTRADNGFYEAEAIVDGLGVEKINSPKFNTAAIKDAAENVRGMIEQIAKTSSIDGNGNRFEKIATDINNIVRDLKFDRSGLKVTYTTEETDANGIKQEKEHSVYSEYNLAATAFQPLGLETLKDLNVQTIPGYERVEALIDRVANSINNQIADFYKEFNKNGLYNKIDKLVINDIVVKDLDDDLVGKFLININKTFTIGGLSYHLKLDQVVNVPVVFDEDLTIPVDIDGLKVSVPIDHTEKVTVNLSDVSIETPTVVVTGHATGHPSNVVDENGDLVTVLVIPILNSDGTPTGQYQTIPLENFDVTVDVNADNTGEGGNAGKLIKLNGEPFASVTIKDTFEGEVDIHDNIPYHLHIEKVFTPTVSIEKDIFFGDPKKDADGNIVYDANGNIVYTDTKSFTFEHSVDLRSAVTDLWGEAQGAIGQVNDLLHDLNDILKDVKSLLAQFNSYETKFIDKVNSVREKLQGYLEKINGAITDVINSANSRLQPFMVANSKKNGMKRLISSKNYPTKMSSDMSLYATSQTMELFVPFARKHVAVTNVFSADLSKNVQDGTLDKSILTSVKGDNLNKVLNGTECEIKLSGMKSDYVYEIAYSALDFKGKMATRKYYITLE